MIPNDTVDRYYYIFDSREQRALVMDRTTGQEYAWDEAPQGALVAHVLRQRSETMVRRFAHWCARQTGAASAPLHTTTGQLWAAVHPTTDTHTLERVRADAVDAAVLAAAVGVPHRRRDAAQLLAVHACTHPTARCAALDAAHMHERWVEFGPEAADTAVQGARQRQINWLLDALDA